MSADFHVFNLELMHPFTSPRALLTLHYLRESQFRKRKMQITINYILLLCKYKFLVSLFLFMCHGNILNKDQKEALPPKEDQRSSGILV